MEIKTKYDIGDKVYVVFEEINKNKIEVCVGTVQDILIKENTIGYYVDTLFEKITEEELIPINDKEGLAKKIDEVSKGNKDE